MVALNDCFREKYVAIFYDHISLQNSRKAGSNSAHGHGMIIDKVSVPADLEPGSNDLLNWFWNMYDVIILWQFM